MDMPPSFLSDLVPEGRNVAETVRREQTSAGPDRFSNTRRVAHNSTSRRGGGGTRKRSSWIRLQTVRQDSAKINGIGAPARLRSKSEHSWMPWSFALVFSLATIVGATVVVDKLAQTPRVVGGSGEVVGGSGVTVLAEPLTALQGRLSTTQNSNVDGVSPVAVQALVKELSDLKDELKAFRDSGGGTGMGAGVSSDAVFIIEDKIRSLSRQVETLSESLNARVETVGAEVDQAVLALQALRGSINDADLRIHTAKGKPDASPPRRSPLLE